MVDPKELRLDNWVYADKEWLDQKPGPFQITCIDVDGVEKDYGGYTLYKPEDISGIPLTPEILKLRGFIERMTTIPKQSQYLIELREPSLTHLSLTVDPDQREEFLTCICAPIMGEYKMLPSNVKYLHQLQNLYFALTGMELPVNLIPETAH